MDELSELQQKVVREIIKNDNGFHASFSTAEYPLYNMLSDSEDGLTIVSECGMAEISDSAINLTLKVWLSREQKCWFFKMITKDNEINGVVHFNTIYNSKGTVSFAFLNDSVLDSVDDITRAIAYSTIFVMRK